jgi:hypothetical protein
MKNISYGNPCKNCNSEIKRDIVNIPPLLTVEFGSNDTKTLQNITLNDKIYFQGNKYFLKSIILFS